MSWFDPEKMVKSLISSLGVSPEDFIGFITMARTEFLEMRADRLAFKPASVKAYQELTGRMERLEAKIELLSDAAERMDDYLVVIRTIIDRDYTRVKPLNGDTIDGRHNGIHPPAAG